MATRTTAPRRGVQPGETPGQVADPTAPSPTQPTAPDPSAAGPPAAEAPEASDPPSGSPPSRFKPGVRPIRPPAQPLAKVAEVATGGNGGNGSGGLHSVTVLSPDRVERYRRSRFNPVLGLTPERLVQYLSDWNAGYLRYLAITMDQVLSRDWTFKTVAPKRWGDAARERWTVQIIEGHEEDSEALAQKEALMYFYQNLRATSAVESDQVGGVSLMVRQMVRYGIGLKYCVHEILWRQTPAGLSAVLSHVPPWFFESRTGKLRFLMEDFAWDGVPMVTGNPTVQGDKLDVASWMVSVGEGLMESGVVLYLYKMWAMRDWADYSEARGTPLLKGHTKAPHGSARWTAFAEALAAMKPTAPMVMGPKEEEDVEILSTAAQGAFAPQLMYEEMKKSQVGLWRGSDLGTMSSGQGQEGTGASLQGGETAVLKDDDCQWISENCQLQLDPLVIRITRGPDVPVLAYFSLGGAKRTNTQLELSVYKELTGLGLPIAQQAAYETFNVPQPGPEQPLLKAPPPPQPFGGGPPGGPGGPVPVDENGEPLPPEEGGAELGPDGQPLAPAAGGKPEDYGLPSRATRPPMPAAFGNELANARSQVRSLVAAALERVGAAQRAELAPLAARLKALANEPDDAKLLAGLRKLRGDAPGLLRAMNKRPLAGGAFADAIGTALVAGAARGTRAVANEGECQVCGQPNDAETAVCWHCNQPLRANADGVPCGESFIAADKTCRVGEGGGRDVSKPEQLTPDEWRRHEQRGTWSDFKDEVIDHAMQEYKQADQEKGRIEAEIRAVNPNIKNLGELPQLDQAVIRNRLKGIASGSVEARRSTLGALAGMVKTTETFQTLSRNRNPKLKELAKQWKVAAARKAAASSLIDELGTHESWIARSAVAGKPVSAHSVEHYGLELPTGYHKRGDLYTANEGTTLGAIKGWVTKRMGDLNAYPVLQDHTVGADAAATVGGRHVHSSFVDAGEGTGRLGVHRIEHADPVKAGMDLDGVLRKHGYDVKWHQDEHGATHLAAHPVVVGRGPHHFVLTRPALTAAGDKANEASYCEAVGYWANAGVACGASFIAADKQCQAGQGTAAAPKPAAFATSQAQEAHAATNKAWASGSFADHKGAAEAHEAAMRAREGAGDKGGAATHKGLADIHRSAATKAALSMFLKKKQTANAAYQAECAKGPSWHESAGKNRHFSNTVEDTALRQQVADALGLDVNDPDLEAKVQAAYDQMQEEDPGNENGTEDGGQPVPQGPGAGPRGAGPAGTAGTGPTAGAGGPGAPDGDAAEAGGGVGDGGPGGLGPDGLPLPATPTAADAPPNLPLPKAPVGPPPELLDFQAFQASGWSAPAALGLAVSNTGQLGAQHKGYIAAAVQARKPVLRRTTDYYGVQVPKGYEPVGDNYEWTAKPQQLPKPVATEADLTQAVASEIGVPAEDPEFDAKARAAWEAGTDAAASVADGQDDASELLQAAAEEAGADVNDPALLAKARAAWEANEATAQSSRPPGYSGGSDELGASQGGVGATAKPRATRDQQATEPFERQDPAPVDSGVHGDGSGDGDLDKAQAVVVGKTPELMTEEEFGASAFGSVASLGVEVALPWHLRSAHRAYVAGALRDRKPVLKAAADEFARDGMALPAGYKDDGNGVYVWTQDRSPALPRTWAQEKVNFPLTGRADGAIVGRQADLATSQRAGQKKEPKTMNANEGENCGTGAGGFQPGNTCGSKTAFSPQTIKFADGYKVKVSTTKVSVEKAGQSGGSCDPLHLRGVEASSRPGKVLQKSGAKLADYLSDNLTFLVRRGNGVEEAVREAAAERRAIDDAWRSENEAEKAAEKERIRAEMANDPQLIAEAESKASELRKQIPDGGVETRTVEAGKYEGEIFYATYAGDVKVSGDDVIKIGVVSAIRPGDKEPFKRISVSYVTKERLDAIRKEREATEQAAEVSRKAVEEARQQKQADHMAKIAEARASGKPVALRRWTESRRAREGGEWGDYQFVVTEFAMPDGSVQQKAVNTF